MHVQHRGDSGNTPSARSAALGRLEEFLPFAGGRYSSRRNYDFGSDSDNAVSKLSFEIRHRVLSEPEICKAVYETHGPSEGEKFIQEVFWRTYWKGWLELRPSVWDEYLLEVSELEQRLSRDHSQRLARAIEGQTGIECFDHWMSELRSTGWLHNHARMWFASIWIFTLELPWQLGADLFLRHLIDGDPASNTLSWRWVAGLQTQGKHYLARASNISKFTQGRFNPAGQLNEEADAKSCETRVPEPKKREELFESSLALQNLSSERTESAAMLLHEDDLLLDQAALIENFERVIFIKPLSKLATGNFSETVLSRRSELYSKIESDFQRQGTRTFSCAPRSEEIASSVGKDISRVYIPFAPVGWVRPTIQEAIPHFSARGIEVIQVVREWDQELYPKATKGFFNFKKQIPAALRMLCHV